MSDATRSPAARCGTYPAVQREQPVTLADALTAVEDLAHALAEIARCQSAAACPQCRQLARDVLADHAHLVTVARRVAP